MFYILAYLALDSGSGTTGMVMQLGAIVVGIFALIFLFYTNSFLIKRRKKELGLYGILGMEKRHIFRMMAYETLYCFLISVVSGLAVGLLFSKGVQLLFLHILQMPVQWGFAFSPSAALVTVLLFAGIFFLTLLSNLRQVHISQPIELLRGSQVGEREPARQLAPGHPGRRAAGRGLCPGAVREQSDMGVYPVLPGGDSGDPGHLRAVHQHQHRGAQAAAAQQDLLLSNEALYLGFGHDLPHEAERRGSG